MNTQASPVIIDMKVIPVAGHDSMLLNIGGAHNACFTRNIVVLKDNAGHTGVSCMKLHSRLERYFSSWCNKPRILRAESEVSTPPSRVSTCTEEVLSAALT